MLVFMTSGSGYPTHEYGVKGRGFPALSITGSWCALGCKHCHGKILERMISVTDPKRLIPMVKRLKKLGVTGILISGGSNYHGEVPFEPFVGAIRKAKELKLKVYMHTGLVDERRAQLLKEVDVDMVLYDVVGSRETIRGILNLSATPDDFYRGLRYLVDYDVRVAPHVVIGLNGGSLRGEREAIDAIGRIGGDAAVVVVFTPYPGTPLGKAPPPPVKGVLKMMKYFREKLEIPISLGCMRPRSRDYKAIERMAIDLGYEGIALPSKRALNYMAEGGEAIVAIPECCASVAELARA